jgi:hypothetical protein
LPDSANAVWQRLSSDRELTAPLLRSYARVFDLTPTALWCEALRIAFLPTIPGRVRLVDPQWWKETRDIFIAGKVSEAHTYAAASQLILDGLLHIFGYHEPDVDWLREARLHG